MTGWCLHKRAPLPDNPTGRSCATDHRARPTTSVREYTGRRSDEWTARFSRAESIRLTVPGPCDAATGPHPRRTHPAHPVPATGTPSSEPAERGRPGRVMRRLAFCAGGTRTAGRVGSESSQAATWALAGARGRRAAVRGVTSLALASATVNTVGKRSIGRARPILDAVPIVRHLPRQTFTSSFPSGHAASAARLLRPWTQAGDANTPTSHKPLRYRRTPSWRLPD